jgi:hypothetical protein
VVIDLMLRMYQRSRAAALPPTRDRGPPCQLCNSTSTEIAIARRAVRELVALAERAPLVRGPTGPAMANEIDGWEFERTP